MTDKDFVLSKHKQAKAAPCALGCWHIYGVPYKDIRPAKTQDEAWINAAARIREREQQEKV